MPDYLTWDDLSQIEIKTITVAKYGNRAIRYKSMIPLDRYAQIEAQLEAIKSPYEKSVQRATAILRECMVEPAIRTEEEARRVVIHADAGLIFAIIGDVINVSVANEIAEGLAGESHA